MAIMIFLVAITKQTAEPLLVKHQLSDDFSDEVDLGAYICVTWRYCLKKKHLNDWKEGKGEVELVTSLLGHLFL